MLSAVAPVSKSEVKIDVTAAFIFFCCYQKSKLIVLSVPSVLCYCVACVVGVVVVW